MRTSVEVEPILNTVESDAAVAGQLSPAEGQAVTRVPLGALLVAEGFIDDRQLNQALDIGSETGERLGEVIVRQRLASEEDIARLLAEQWDLSYVDRASIWFDADALARLSREDAQRLEAMPTRVEDGRVVVAVAEPTEHRLAALREVIGEDTVVVVVPKTALEAGLHSELLASNGRGGNPKGRESTASRDAASSTSDAIPGRPRTVMPKPAMPKPLPGWADEEPSGPAAASRSAVDPQVPQNTGTLAQSLAELIEAQIGATRESSADDQGRLAALEQRIVQLEDALAGNRAALAELGRHLQSIAGILGKL